MNILEKNFWCRKEMRKNRFFGLISWNFQDYIKKSMICNKLPCTASLMKIVYKLDLISGSKLRKTTKKQPKVLLFAATRNFENI